MVISSFHQPKKKLNFWDNKLNVKIELPHSFKKINSVYNDLFLFYRKRHVKFGYECMFIQFPCSRVLGKLQNFKFFKMNFTAEFQ